jgi:RNA polymerase sigma-70 factor (ECF subfamily)
MSDAGSSLLLQTTLPDYDELRGFFRRRVECQHEAQDLTQETFARLIRWRPAQEVDQPRSLLFRIARNLLVDRARSRARFAPEVLTDEMIERTASLAANPAQRADAAERLQIVQAAMAALPERCREVFVLSRFGGLSYAEIAARLGIAPSTVEKHMIRALAVCKAALAEPAA